MTMCSTNTRSSLELMLDSIRRRDERPIDVPPALPIRPVSRARFPPGRRRLPLRLQKSCLIEDCKENEAGNEEDNCGGFVLKKIDSLDGNGDTREKALEKILEIQKSFRGHQVRYYYLQLRRGTITLQSFVRGEKARKDYQVLSRRLEAVIVIQQYTKRWIDWITIQKRQKAVIVLQSAIRGWLTRKCLNYKEKFRISVIEHQEDIIKPDRINPGITDYVQVLPSALADLRKRLLRVETELGNKEEENAAMRQQLHQFDRKWSQYEANMRSMERNWQDQLISLQMSLVAAKKSLATESSRNQLGKFIPIPLYNCSRADETMPDEPFGTHGKCKTEFISLRFDNEPQPRNSKVDDINQHSAPSRRSFHDDLGKSPDEEVRDLKLRFETWKKEYKIRLQEAKAILQKLGHSQKKKNRKRWWRRLKKKGDQRA